MGSTNRERILDHLWSISPDWATNSQIRDATGIKSHQQVYLLTQELLRAGLIHGERRGRKWVFWANESLAVQLTSPGPASPHEVSACAERRLTPRAFEELARAAMSMHFDVPLTPGEVPGVPKRFDLVSPDKDIVGDAKYFTLVRGQRLPTGQVLHHRRTRLAAGKDRRAGHVSRLWERPAGAGAVASAVRRPRISRRLLLLDG